MPPFKTGLFFLPTAGSRARIEQGMAGQDPAAFQQMLSEVRELGVLADDIGYDAIAFTEHHFHIEGFEVSNNPVLLDADIAARTKRIRVGQLGIVLPANNPIKVAEDIAILDHLSNGRAFAGFARGYQRRWVDTFAQQYHGVHVASTSPTRDQDLDATNREAFEEFFQIVKLAWTDETFSYSGKFWQIPAQDTPWTLPISYQLGKGAADGFVREVGISPRPLQQPHPQIMQPFSVSERTIRWCAQNGVMPILAAANDVLEDELYTAYHEEANAVGRNIPRGESIAILRDVIVADTDEEAFALWKHGPAFAFASWFRPFGFDRPFIRPGEDPSIISGELLRERGIIWVGSPATVRRQVEETLERLPVTYVMASMYNGLVPQEANIKSLKLFNDEVLAKIGK